MEPWFHSWYRGRVETLDAKYNLAYINSTLYGHTISLKGERISDNLPLSLSLKVHAPWEPLYCSNRRAEYRRLEWLHNSGPPSLKRLLFYGPELKEQDLTKCLISDIYRSPELGGMAALTLPKGWSHIQIPGIVPTPRMQPQKCGHTNRATYFMWPH